MKLSIFITAAVGIFAFADAKCIPGSSWKQGNAICHCSNWGIPTCYDKLGLCDAWGDPHFTSFDGKKFDFQGTCRYILARDCCSKKFTVEAELIEWSATTSVTDKITVRFGANRVVNLEKVNVLEVDGVVYPGLFYDDPEVRCEMVSGYMFVTLKTLAVWVRWNFHYHVQVYVHPKYRNGMCGLCGDFNGNPNNDLTLSQTGEPVTPINEWAESWRTMHQPKRCEGVQAGNNDDNKCDENPAHAQQMKQCDDVISGPVFDKCRGVVKPGTFIEDCRTEMCACAEAGKKGCICHALSAYIDACEEAGIIISDSWKAEYDCGVCRVGRNVYQHGTSWRVGCKVFTCNNGVYLPPKTLENCCLDKDLNQWFPDGQTWTYKCEVRACKQGKIVTKVNKFCCRDGEKTYLHGQTWQNGCYIKRCYFSKIITSIDKDCCYYSRSYYQPGQGYSPNPCERCTCSVKEPGQWDCVKFAIKCAPGYYFVPPCSCIKSRKYPIAFKTAA